MGRSDRVVLPAPHGECRELVTAHAYKHGKTRRYSGISIPDYRGSFNLILLNGCLCFACNNAEN